MLRLRNGVPAALFVAACGIAFCLQDELGPGFRLTAQPPASASPGVELHAARTAPSDLEIGGDLSTAPSGATRYVTLDDLEKLPQVSYIVSDDTNFSGATKISGPQLADLPAALGAGSKTDLIIAICDDEYRTNYTRRYMDAHHPLLVLDINGKPPSGWPKDPGGHGYDMGPFLISHPQFTPSYSVLSIPERPQIPWGVVRLEFWSEQTVFGAIAPRGGRASATDVQQGLALAKQNCFRCHNMGSEGGQKAGVSWEVVGEIAAKTPQFFASYVRDPQKLNPQALMEGTPQYGNRPMQALIAYFETFANPQKRTGDR